MAFKVLALNSRICEEKCRMHTVLLGIMKLYISRVLSVRYLEYAAFSLGPGRLSLLHKALGEGEGFQREVSNMVGR